MSFDRGSGFEPGRYELARVPKTAMLGARPDKPGGPHTTKLRGPRHMTINVRSVLGGQRAD